MKTKQLSAFYFLLFTFYLCLFQSVSAQNLTVKEIMQEPSIAGMRVESQQLSPDGKYVVYRWNAEGRHPLDLYLVPTSGGEARKILSPKDLLTNPPSEEKEDKLAYGVIVDDEFVKSRRNQIGNLNWSPDSSKLLLSQNGDLYILKIGEKQPRRLTNTRGFEGGASWLDNQRIMFSQSGNLFVVDTEKFSIIQISTEANPQRFISVFGGNASKNGEFIAYIVSDGSAQRALFVPDYVGEFVQTPSVRRGWSEQKVLVAKSDGSLEKPLEIKLPKAEGKSYFAGLRWAADNSSLIVNRIDKTTKRRQLFYIYNVGRKDEKTILVTEETDEKWIAPLSGIIEPNPKDSSQLFFGSERDGFNHLYLATLESAKPEPNPTGEIRGENSLNPGFTGKVEIKQLTKGNWQVEWARWNGLRDTEIIFSSTQKNPSEREMYVVYTRENEMLGVKIGDVSLLDTKFNLFNSVTKTHIKDSGMKGNFQITENSTNPALLFSFSQWNKPTELYFWNYCDKTCAITTPPVQLTKTTPESFLKRKWNEPKFLEINSRDGKKIPAKIYLPADFNKSKKYPMAIFVHGAGYLQNVINGWNNYYREFMFNQLLTQKGYVVLDIDFRGSAGYGRDWRTDVYDFLGGKDSDDHIDAIDYMVANYSVNPQKVGVYGGSYGGFIAGMLVMRFPDKVAAAAALRPVFDWKNYYASSPVYTAQRLGIPSENPEAYKRSSPIFYADKLEKPLLILHGLVDSNVPAQDSIQLIEKLIRLEKTEFFEAMLYPVENHAFERPTSWTDEYIRILDLFEEHLKN